MNGTLLCIQTVICLNIHAILCPNVFGQMTSRFLEYNPVSKETPVAIVKLALVEKHLPNVPSKR